MYSKRKRNYERHNIWRSYSDMMAGLLLLFVLVMCISFMEAQKNYQEKLQEEAAQDVYKRQIRTYGCDCARCCFGFFLCESYGRSKGSYHRSSEEHCEPFLVHKVYPPFWYILHSVYPTVLRRVFVHLVHFFFFAFSFWS